MGVRVRGAQGRRPPSTAQRMCTQRLPEPPPAAAAARSGRTAPGSGPLQAGWNESKQEVAGGQPLKPLNTCLRSRSLRIASTAPLGHCRSSSSTGGGPHQWRRASRRRPPGAGSLHAPLGARCAGGPPRRCGGEHTCMRGPAQRGCCRGPQQVCRCTGATAAARGRTAGGCGGAAAPPAGSRRPPWRAPHPPARHPHQTLHK